MTRADVLDHRGVAGVESRLPSPHRAFVRTRVFRRAIAGEGLGVRGRRVSNSLQRALRHEPIIRRAWPATFPRKAGREFLQRAVPVRQVDVDLAHLDAMFACIANELCRRVEAERLGIEHRGGEDVRIAALHPARSVDEKREASRMTFWKTVFTEAFDLAEAALGEIA